MGTHRWVSYALSAAVFAVAVKAALATDDPYKASSRAEMAGDVVTEVIRQTHQGRHGGDD